MKHLLTSLLLLSFGSSIFAQSSPPNGWSWTYNPSNGHYYALTLSANWQDTQDEAESANGQLVTINDQAENDWVVANIDLGTGFDSAVWIGYSLNGAWEWVSGSNSSYENWDVGEPNGGGSNYPYANMWGSSAGGTRVEGAWNDFNDRSLPGIIEWTDTLYVDGTGNGDYLDIQSAIDAAYDGNTVIVRDGVYDESITLDESKHITLKSENGPANCSIINSTSIVVNFIDAATTSVIDGFTIGWTSESGIDVSHGGSPTILNCIIEECDDNGIDLNGSPTIENCIIRNCEAGWGGGIEIHGAWLPGTIINNSTIENCSADYGAGIYMTSNATAKITGALIRDCKAVFEGGGLYADTDVTSLALESCIFLSNEAGRNGGGMGFTRCSPTLDNCTFTDNTATEDGGGMWFNNSSAPTLTDCTFANNESSSQGGAVYCDNGAPMFVNCIFENNTADTGGGGTCFYNSSPTLEDCMFTANTAVNSGSQGGAVVLDGSDGVFTNCLFDGNSASNDGGGVCVQDNANANLDSCTFAGNAAGRGGGVYTYSSAIILRDSIIWGSSGSDIYIDSGTATVNYSCIQSGWVGTGNINADPLFVDAANGDYRLQHIATGHVSDSPCIDTGDPAITPFGSTRIDGFPDTGIIDMGYRLPVSDIDTDYDGLIDVIESVLGTNLTDQDTDDDGLSDGEEYHSYLTDPLNIDSDLDGLQDGTEVGNDTFWAGNPSYGISGTDTSINIPDTDPSTTTNPLDDDTDNDGLMDGQEDVNHDGQFLGIELDPNDFDCDNDGLGDGLELGLAAPNGNDTDMTVFVADADPSTTTRATFRDTDGGGIHDGLEDANRNGMIDAGEIDPRDASDDSVYMKISPMVEGGSVTFSYLECEPGSLMVLCYSQVGTGPTFFTNLTLDLSQPIGSRPPLQINSYGTAQLGPVPIPPNIIVGDQIWFQGVQVSLFGSASSFTTTNMIPITVQ